MPSIRQMRKALGSMFSISRQEEKLAYLERKIRFLYEYLQLNPGERQYATRLEDVRSDHLGRYEFACKYIKQGQNVVDAACGVGYGSYVIASTTGATVTGIDISDSAITVANMFWSHKNNRFLKDDCTRTSLAPASQDVAISFETIEHIENAGELLAHLNLLLKPGGLLICSTPNEEVWPHDPNKQVHHVRHYTAKDLEQLVSSRGFKVKGFWSQSSSRKKDVVPGKEGRFHILVCEKTSEALPAKVSTNG